MFKKLGVSAFLLCIYSMQTFASEEPHHGDAHGGDAAHHATSGLPQLDPSTYLSQGFWLVAVFVLMYFFFAKKTLPKITRTVENRADRINNDLDSAERLKEEVASVQKTYEEKQAKAREEAAALFSGVENDMKAKAEQYSKDFHNTASKEVKRVEGNIGIAIEDAMKDMTQIAAAVATEATEKIIGVRVDEKNAIKVVESLSKAA